MSDENRSSDSFLADQMARLDGQQDSSTTDFLRNKAGVIENLKRLGVAVVEVEYDGSGDEGFIESILAKTPEGKGIDLGADIAEGVEEFVYDVLPAGWEINDGSFGVLQIDVMNDRVIFEHSRRIMNVRTSCREK